MSFAAGTLVLGEKGYFPIKKFRSKQLPGQRLRVLELGNGLRMTATSDQCVYVIRRQGVPEQRPLQELRPGDRVLMDYRRVDGAPNFGKGAPGACENPLFWSMLGYARMYGYYPTGHNQDALRMIAYVREQEKILQLFESEFEELMAVLLTGEHPTLSFLDPALTRWLRAFGFRGALDGYRNIPDQLFSTPAWAREAFLRGLFAAVGEWRSEKSTRARLAPTLAVGDPELRQGILRLLWSVGCASSERREWGVIVVRDIAAFIANVGFMQGQREYEDTTPLGFEGRWDTLHPATATAFMKHLKEQFGWYHVLTADERERFLRKKIDGSGLLRRKLVLDAYERLRMEPPEAVRYHHATVARIVGASKAPTYELPRSAYAVNGGIRIK